MDFIQELPAIDAFRRESWRVMSNQRCRPARGRLALATKSERGRMPAMKTLSPLRLWWAFASAALPPLAVAQIPGSSLQIKPQFVPDEMIIVLAHDQMPGPPPSGQTPDDLYAAAGVTVISDQVLTPSEVVEHRVRVRLDPDASFGRAFRIIQTFEFGPESRWFLRYVQPNHVFCAIPEGCPGVLETSRVFNFSARADVRPGEKVVIGGMVVPGEYARLVVFKVWGPSLAHFGVGAVLANPRMRLHRGSEVILENDDWGALREWEMDLARTVCPPPDDPLESMLVTYLDPGVYTAIVSGGDDGSGVALLEMYLLDAFRIEPGGG